MAEFDQQDPSSPQASLLLSIFCYQEGVFGSLLQ